MVQTATLPLMLEKLRLLSIALHRQIRMGHWLVHNRSFTALPATTSANSAAPPPSPAPSGGACARSDG